MAKNKEIKTKTNAMRILESEGIEYKLHVYDTEDGKIDAESVAEKCGEAKEQVFKTLVTRANDLSFHVFVIPADTKLDLKKAASAAGVKSVEMIAQKELFPLTGYVHGGCSPIGMKKLFPTVIDETAVLFDTICVSAGKIGMQAEINPQKLIELVGGSFGDLTREDG